MIYRAKQNPVIRLGIFFFYFRLTGRTGLEKKKWQKKVLFLITLTGFYAKIKEYISNLIGSTVSISVNESSIYFMKLRNMFVT